MKKIVMAVAAIAMAATMFAADVAAAVQGYGDLFNVTIEEGKDTVIKAIGWNDPWDRQFGWYSTGIGFSATADKAGVSFELDNRDVTVKNSCFWIQPLDMVKIALGANSIGLAKETIEYSGTVYNSDYEGFKVTVTPIEGLAIDLGLVTGANGGWSTAYYIKEGKIGQTIVSAAYDAGDIGKVTVVYDYNAKNTIAVDYAGTFAGVSVSPAVAYVIEDKALAADLYVTANVAGVGIQAYTKYDADFDGKTNAVAVNTKFSYGTPIGTASLQIKDGDILAKAFAMTVKADLAFNCGSCGMNLGVAADIAKGKTVISVPFQYNLHF